MRAGAIGWCTAGKSEGQSTFRIAASNSWQVPILMSVALCKGCQKRPASLCTTQLIANEGSRYALAPQMTLLAKFMDMALTAGMKTMRQPEHHATTLHRNAKPLMLLSMWKCLLIVGQHTHVVHTLGLEFLHLLDKPWDVAGAAHWGVCSWHSNNHSLQNARRNPSG